MHSLFIPFVESMKDHDPALIEAVISGFEAIFEDVFHKESSIVSMFTNGRNDKTRTVTPTTWIWDGVNNMGETEDAGTVMATDYYEAIRKTVIDIKERRIPWMQFDKITLHRK